MNKFFEIVKKNIRQILRQKSSLVTIFIGPLLLVLLLGSSFNSSGFNSIRIGYVLDGESELSSVIINQLGNEFETVRVRRQDVCKQKLMKSEVHVCMFIPENLNKEKTQNSNEILFYVDNTRVNLVYMILDAISDELSETSSDISLELTNKLLEKIDLADEELNKDIPVLKNLKKNNLNISSALLQIYTDFKELDLIMYPEEYDIENLEKKQEQIMETNIGLISAAKITSKDAIKTIDEIIDVVSSSSINYSQKLDMENNLLDMRAMLAELKSKASSTSSNNDYTYEQIKSLVVKINLLLNETYEKMKIASSVKKYSVEDIDAIINDLNGNYKELDGLETSLAGVTDGFNDIKLKNASKIVNPIITIVKPIAADTSHLNYIFPTLIVVLVMFTSTLLSATITNVENKSKAFFRNSISTANEITFISANYVTNLCVVLIQICLLLSIAKLFFGLTLNFSLIFLVMLLLISTIFILIGIMVGNIFSSENSTILAGVTITSLFLFMSNTVLPLEAVPDSLRQILQYNPFVVSEIITKQLLIYDLGIKEMFNSINVVLVYILILFMLNYIYYSFIKKKS